MGSHELTLISPPVNETQRFSESSEVPHARIALVNGRKANIPALAPTTRKADVPMTSWQTVSKAFLPPAGYGGTRLTSTPSTDHGPDTWIFDLWGVWRL